MSKSVPKHIYLIDASGYIFRAFYGLPAMTRADGTPINAVFGFCNMVYKLVEETDADYIGVVFDKARQSFRNEIYPAYKANRADAPEELIPQFPLVREATLAFNLPVLESDGFEADDLIATYAKHALALGAEVTVVSSDKDLMQLIRPGLSLWDPMKSRQIGVAQVREKFGVPPEKVIDVQALAGDSADNVPGVQGIGPKIAAELITNFGDLESLLQRSEEVKQPKRRQSLQQQAEMARLSKRLVTLKDDVSLAIPLEGLKRQPVDTAKVLAFLEQQQFRRLIARYKMLPTPTAETRAPEATPKTHYHLVQDLESLAAWCHRIENNGLVVVDTETTSLDVMEAKLVGIALAIKAGEACYIPLRHKTASTNQDDLLATTTPNPPRDSQRQIPIADALRLLKPIFEDPAILKVGQNLKYDVSILANEGIAVSPIEDTMLISFVLDAGKTQHGLDELATRHLGVKPIAFVDVAGSGKKQLTFDYVPLEQACQYAAEDADLTLQLYQLLKPRLVTEKITALYEQVERPLVPLLAQMERNGVLIDQLALKELSGEFGHKLNILEKDIHQLAGMEFNVASPKQLGPVLFEKLALPGGKKTKTGLYATGAEILEPLLGQHPIIEKMLNWRMLSKLKSTYTDALVTAVNSKTQRVHTRFNVTGAQTGRLSSNDPNIQNIPIRTAEGIKIRAAFIAPKDCKLISLDYSQIELRLMAEIAGLETMQNAFHQGIDIHAMTASQVFALPLDQLTPEDRRKAKAINFGIIYGISAFGLANQLGVSRSAAKDFIDQYFQRFPGIQHFMEKTKALCRDQGFVETLFGRRIHITQIRDKNPMRRNYAERQAINAPIQGSAADIIKKAMGRIPNALEKAGLTEARLLLQVHDELIFEAPTADCPAVISVVRKVMENAHLPQVTLTVPLIVDAGVGDNWRTAH